MEHAEPGALRVIGPYAFWSGLIALAIAIPLAAWMAAYASARLRRVVAFARRIADGDLTARLDSTDDDELSAIEAALNQLKQFADAIMNFLTNDELRRIFGLAGQKFIERYDWDKVAKQEILLIEGLQK